MYPTPYRNVNVKRFLKNIFSLSKKIIRMTITMADDGTDDVCSQSILTIEISG